MEKINTPADGRCGYVAFSHNGRRADVWADSKSKAQELAVAHFRAPKSKRHMVHVALAEVDGKEVVHTAVD